MKLNYPVRYAAMPITEQVGWVHGGNELERDYDVVCYIISRCYLLSSQTKYRENGRILREYEVFFPYQLSNYGIWKREVPSFNVFSGNCTDSVKVDFVFDSYDEAVKYVDKRNLELKDKTLSYLPYSNDFLKRFQEKEQEFDERLSKYKVLEQEILDKTNELEYREVKELDFVIGIKDGSSKVWGSSLYEIINLFDGDNFLIYTISQQKYDEILERIRENDTSFIEEDEMYQRLLLINNPSGVMDVIDESSVKSAYLNKNKRLCFYCDSDDKYMTSCDKGTYIFFTTETYKDIVSSFKDYESINLSKSLEKVIEKK